MLDTITWRLTWVLYADLYTILIKLFISFKSFSLKVFGPLFIES